MASSEICDEAASWFEQRGTRVCQKQKYACESNDCCKLLLCLTLVCGPSTRQRTYLPVQVISCHVVWRWLQFLLRWCYNSLKKQFDFGGLANLHEACYCCIFMLGCILHTPPLPYWAPCIGNMFSTTPIQSWLGCFALSCVGNLKCISDISKFHLMMLCKLRSRCGFESRTFSAARSWKICSYAVTSAWTSFMTVWKKRTGVHT